MGMPSIRRYRNVVGDERNLLARFAGAIRRSDVRAPSAAALPLRDAVPLAKTDLTSGGYRQVLRFPGMKVLLAGCAPSDVGDNISFVAIPWTAISISTPKTAALLTGAAVAAYVLPGALGPALFGRWLRRFSSLTLVRADAILRAVTLGIIPIVNIAGLLTSPTFVGLLAASSLLHACGLAGRYTLVAELLPGRSRLTGNALINSSGMAGVIAGPAIAGLIIGVSDAPTAIAIDAVSFAILAVATLGIPRGSQRASLYDSDAKSKPPMKSGLEVLRRDRELATVLIVSFLFAFLYGPIEVALPLFVQSTLFGNSALLATIWTCFGIGAVIGGLATRFLDKIKIEVSMCVIIFLWGASLVPPILIPTAWVAVASFALGGLFFAPFPALCYTVFQRQVSGEQLSAVLAVRTSFSIVAAPTGSAVGGPISNAIGPGSTILLSGLSTVVLALVSWILIGQSRSRVFNGSRVAQISREPSPAEVQIRSD